MVMGMLEAVNHPTQTLTDPQGASIEIDTELVPLIERLWRLGLETISCCQNGGEAMQPLVRLAPHLDAEAARRLGCAYVDFTVDSGLRFLTAIANSGPRNDFYVRMVHWAAPGAWHVAVRPEDVATDDETQPSEFDLWLLQVAFPRTDLDEILRRLDEFENGKVLHPSPIDWSSIEISDSQLDETT
jgi:hypothetical protein